MFRKLWSLGRMGNHRPRRDCRPAPAARRNRWTPQCEQLETRAVPAVSVSISNRVLNVIGDGAVDTIGIDHAGTNTIVTRSAPAPPMLTFADASFDRIEINSGGGSDTVNLLRTVKPTNVTSSGGTDTVNVGNSINGVQNILAPLNITNPPSFSTININNTGDTGGRVGTHSINTATAIATIAQLAPASISYRTPDLQALNITLGGGGDTFLFLNTDNAPTTLNTGPSGFGTNLVFVDSTGGPLTVTGGLSDDTVNVGTLGFIAPGLVLNGGTGIDTLNFNDTFAGAASDYFLQPTTLSRNSAVVVTYGGFDHVLLRTSDFADSIAVIAPPGTNTTVNGNGGDDNFFVGLNPATYNGGPGSDTLWAPDGTNFWLVTGQNRGNYNGVATFLAIESLVGNGSHDTFHVFNGAGLSGFLWDQGGNATLDYSASAAGVTVNLTIFQATGIAGGVYGIADVTGGFGNDILVGDDFPNVLEGGPGRDLLIGGGASYFLFADFLIGGLGEDILIGGFTAYDADAASLTAILTAWAGPPAYATRVANLLSGSGAPALNATTVFYNYSLSNVLLGGADLDLFFGDPGFDLSDRNPSTESFIQVF